MGEASGKTSARAGRRGFLHSTLAASTGLLLPASLRAQGACLDPLPGAQLLGSLPLSGLGGVEHPLGTLLGRGLDARLATDLSTLTPESLVTPNERFFVRSEAPLGIETRRPWTIRIGGLVQKPLELPLSALLARVAPLGTFLVECAGNNNPANFGLMSAAAWAGVPLARVLEEARPLAGGTRVLVSGLDPEPGPSRRSLPGASWIFSMDEIARFRPFLATEMNGVPLPAAHGAPVRLLVPRWYGCASIKWVDAIQVVDVAALSTPHMREFARRTHQDGVPELARDFRSASVDLAAMPVRVEKWRLANGAPRYRIVGVMWGGERATDALQIGLGGDDVYAPVSVCPQPASNDSWTLWSYDWRPSQPGRYKIVMKAADRSIATRRLDLYYYIREVRVDEA